MGSKTTVSAPAKTAEETALLQQQTAMLRQQQEHLTRQQAEQDLLKPLMFGQLGIEEQRDPTGKLIGYQKAALTPAQLQQQELESQLRQRSLDALGGKLPVDPGLERGLTEGRAGLEAQLMRDLGTGFATSTPGMQALAEQAKRAEELRYGARTGQLSLSEQLAGAREGRGMAGQAQTFGQTMGTAQSGLPFIQGGLGVAQGFSGPLSNLAQDRNMQMQAMMSNQQSANTRRGQNLSFASNMFGNIFPG